MMDRDLGVCLLPASRWLKALVNFWVDADSYNVRRRRTQSDPIMDLVVLAPGKTLTFVRGGLFMSLIMCLLFIYPEAILSNAANVTNASNASEFMHWWLTVNRVVQVGHASIKLLYLYIFGRMTGTTDREIIYCMSVVTSAKGWKIRKWLHCSLYCWYIAGFVTCRLSDAQPLHPILLYIFSFCALKFVLTLALFYHVFPPFTVARTPKLMRPGGELRQVVYNESGITSNCCGICLDDFQPDTVVKLLPCNHGFHCACIDVWLQKSQLCPFCMHSVK